MRRSARSALASSILWLVALPLAAQPAPAAPDPRIGEADSLLGDADQYERAAELYRAVLLVDPGNVEVEYKLARVLSWDRHFDASVAAYDRVIAEGSIASARVERAEVLSWAERYLEAEEAFRELLVENPRDARAARGLARTLSWDGRRNQAARAYEEALHIEEDADARREWQRLLEGYRPTLHSDSDYLRDSDDFEVARTRLEQRTHLDYETQVVGSFGFINVDTEQQGVSGDRGYESTFGVRRSLTEKLSAELHAGVRGYENYGVFPLARAKLVYSAGEAGSYTLGLDHRDALDRTISARAAQQDIHDTSFDLSVWKPFGEHMELWAGFSGATLSDSNGRHGLQTSFTWRPWTERQLRFTASTGYVGYTINTPGYYSPRVDTTTRIGASHRQGMPWGFSLDLAAGRASATRARSTEAPRSAPPTTCAGPSPGSTSP